MKYPNKTNTKISKLLLNIILALFFLTISSCSKSQREYNAFKKEAQEIAKRLTTESEDPDGIGMSLIGIQFNLFISRFDNFIEANPSFAEKRKDALSEIIMASEKAIEFQKKYIRSDVNLKPLEGAVLPIHFYLYTGLECFEFMLNAKNNTARIALYPKSLVIYYSFKNGILTFSDSKLISLGYSKQLFYKYTFLNETKIEDYRIISVRSNHSNTIKHFIENKEICEKLNFKINLI